jgi:hypothetical protein
MQIKSSLPYVGYGLALFSILDLLIYLFPLGFLNSNWEFNTFNYFVDSSPGTIIGFWLVLSQEFVNSGERSKIEKKLMGFLAWLALFLSIIYFALIPFGVSAAFRIYKSNNAQFFDQQNIGIERLEEVGKRIATASDQDLAALQKEINNNRKIPEILSPDKFKQNLSEQLESQLKAIKTQTQQSVSNNKEVILKRTLKSVIGASIISFIFLRFWLQNENRKQSIIKLLFPGKYRNR